MNYIEKCSLQRQLLIKDLLHILWKCVNFVYKLNKKNL